MSTTVSVCTCEYQICTSVSINLNAEFEFGYLPLDIPISVRSMVMAFTVNPTVPKDECKHDREYQCVSLVLV